MHCLLCCTTEVEYNYRQDAALINEISLTERRYDALTRPSSTVGQLSIMLPFHGRRMTQETRLWHRITLFLTWASVVCHKELRHCGQPGADDSPVGPRFHYRTITHTQQPPRFSFRATVFGGGLFCFVLFCICS